MEPGRTRGSWKTGVRVTGKTWLLLSAAFVSASCVLAEQAPAQKKEFTFWGKPEFAAPSAVLAGTAEPLGERSRLRIAFYNIENFTDGVGDDPDRTPEIMARQAAGAAALIDRIDPDIQVFCETENATSVLALNRALKKPFPQVWITELGSGDGGKHEQKLQLVLLSRVPIAEVREIDFAPLQGPGRPTRGLLRFAVDLGGNRKLLCYGVHLKSNWGVRERNIAQRQHALNILLKDIDWVKGHHKDTEWEMLILGDTNVDPTLLPQFEGDASFAALASWHDLWKDVPAEKRVTCDTRRGDPALEFPPATFDRIFVSEALMAAPWKAGPAQNLPEGTDTKNSRTPPGTGSHVSDHYPVYVDIVK